MKMLTRHFVSMIGVEVAILFLTAVFFFQPS